MAWFTVKLFRVSDFADHLISLTIIPNQSQLIVNEVRHPGQAGVYRSGNQCFLTWLIPQ
jgi:hypothetical protein